MVRNVPIDEVRVLRYPDSPECSVVVDVRGKEMVLRCRDTTKLSNGHELNVSRTSLRTSSAWSR
jgi:hypothetical protein